MGKFKVEICQGELLLVIWAAENVNAFLRYFQVAYFSSAFRTLPFYQYYQLIINLLANAIIIFKLDIFVPDNIRLNFS